jgi:hypothetical protein
MTNIAHVTQTMTDDLQAAGIRAVADPRNITPPCVLVTFDLLEFESTTGVDVTWTLYALAPGPANLDAINTLELLRLQVMEHLEIETVELIGYTTGEDDAARYPAYKMTLKELV